MTQHNLNHLSPVEQRMVSEFMHLLEKRFGILIRSILIFGSKARGDSTPDSDLDVLVVVDSDDWQIHKQIRYLAADICLKYGLELSPRVWSVTHRQEMEELQLLFYQNILRDGINLLEPSSAAS